MYIATILEFYYKLDLKNLFLQYDHYIVLYLI